jgi:hypothetical protein
MLLHSASLHIRPFPLSSRSISLDGPSPSQIYDEQATSHCEAVTTLLIIEASNHISPMRSHLQHFNVWLFRHIYTMHLCQ